MDLSARAVSLALRDEHVLLVLDNAEDALSADGAKIGALAQSILEACPSVSLLLTSRRSIGGCLAGKCRSACSKQIGSLQAKRRRSTSWGHCMRWRPRGCWSTVVPEKCNHPSRRTNCSILHLVCFRYCCKILSTRVDLAARRSLKETIPTRIL